MLIKVEIFYIYKWLLKINHNSEICRLCQILQSEEGVRPPPHDLPSVHPCFKLSHEFRFMLFNLKNCLNLNDLNVWNLNGIYEYWNLKICYIISKHTNKTKVFLFSLFLNVSKFYSVYVYVRVILRQIFKQSKMNRHYILLYKRKPSTRGRVGGNDR